VTRQQTELLHVAPIQEFVVEVRVEAVRRVQVPEAAVGDVITPPEETEQNTDPFQATLPEFAGVVTLV
jgi:hypothetical protein